MDPICLQYHPSWSGTYPTFCGVLYTLQENCNTPLEHTPGNPRSQVWKESLHSLLVKGLGVCSKGVLKQPVNPSWLWGNLHCNRVLATLVETWDHQGNLQLHQAKLVGDFLVIPVEWWNKRCRFPFRPTEMSSVFWDYIWFDRKRSGKIQFTQLTLVIFFIVLWLGE